MSKRKRLVERQAKNKILRKGWIWPAVASAAFVFLLGLAAILARPVASPRDVLAPDAQIGEVHTFFSPT